MQRCHFVYHGNSGFILRTLGDGDDPLDVLVPVQEAVQPLSILRARPIGMMHMVDEGQNDETVSQAMNFYEKHFAPAR